MPYLCREATEERVPNVQEGEGDVLVKEIP